MAITQAFCTSFKKELLDGIHDFRTAGDAFKIALYTSAATLSAATTVYATTNEASGTGYSAGGLALTKVNPTSAGTVGYTDFNPDATWGTSTITANGALIYNTTETNKACIVLAFGGDKSSSNGNFTVQFPTANSTAAIIRVQ